MSTRSRVAYLAVAVLIAVVAFVVLGSGDDREERTATATPTPGPARSPAGEEDDPDKGEPLRAPLLEPGEERSLAVREGDRVAFRVRSDTADRVHVHGYDEIRDVPAGRTVTVRFPATITGVFEIELEASHEPLGRLKVEPLDTGP